MSLKNIIKYLVAWRLLILLFAFLGMLLVPLQKDFNIVKPGFHLDNLLSMWSNFDGLHYMALAKYGYGTPQTNAMYAFFPAFPWLIRTFNIFGDYLVSGLFISHLSLIAAVYFLYRLLRFDLDKKTALRTIFLISIFPTAFFLGSIYSESFFLLVSVLTFYFARKGNFLLSCLFGLIASATRLAGIFLWPALVIEFWLFHEQKIKSIIRDPKTIFLLLPPIGLISYMKLQLIQTGSALTFIISQPKFGANREVNRLILLHQVFYRYGKMIVFFDNRLNPLFFTVLLELITGALFLILILFAFKKLRLSYAVYGFLSYLLPTLTGTFSSLPRYVLIIFPAFMLLATWYQKQTNRMKTFYITLSLLFTFFAVIFFTRGYFVS